VTLLTWFSLSFGKPVAPAAATTSWTDPSMLGAMGLVLVGAALVGIGVYRVARPTGVARELSLVAAFATIAGLAWLGVPAAGMLVWIAIALVAVVWVLMALSNF
jgi:hypothetical protein